MQNDVYLIYLAEVGRNQATFAVYTEWISLPGQEIREPSLANCERVNSAMYNLDRGALRLTNWNDFYAWLGHKKQKQDSGWATFDAASARELAPGWLSDQVRLDCTRLENGPISFIDRNCGVKDLAPFVGMIGPSPEKEGYADLCQIADNLVITRKPIFQL